MKLISKQNINLFHIYENEFKDNKTYIKYIDFLEPNIRVDNTISLFVNCVNPEKIIGLENITVFF